MKRRLSRISPDSAGKVSPEGSAPQQRPGGEDRGVGRRAMLRRGGVVVAGAVGAGVAGAAVAGSANAATGSPVVQGQVNSVGTDQPATEITVTNNLSPTPTVILTNPGSRTVNTVAEASPPLRLTPSAVANPSFSAGVGGDMVATNDGELWFTHNIATVGPVPAIVHTDVNSNSFVPLSAPQRILDTRTAAGRVHVLDPVGKFDSAGRLLAGKIIHIDLTGLVIFGDAVTSNLTAVLALSGGFMTLWSGAGSRPNASSINFTAGSIVANLTVSGIAQFNPASTAPTDSVGIFSLVTTHVLLDVGGFNVGDIAQVNPAFAASTMRGAARAERVRQALKQRGNLAW
jgi:hypothetical protein